MVVGRREEGAGLLTQAFREVMRNSEDYIFVKDADLVYWGGSEAFARMAGQQSADQLTGKTDFDLFPRDIAEKYRADDRGVLESGQPIEGVVERLPDLDGQPRWTRTWKHAVRDSQGRLAGIYGIGRDVTQEVGLEAEAESSRRYVDIVRNLPGGVGILHRQDGQLWLDYANDGWCRAHHIGDGRCGKLAGSCVQPLICQQDMAMMEQEFERVEREGGQGSATYRVWGDDGQLHWLSVQFRFAYETEGVHYYYASYSDMDDQKQWEEKLADSQRALREAITHTAIQFFTYFPGQHRCEVYAVNTRLSELPTRWENFPDDFLQYTRASDKDAQSYRDMLRKIDSGEESAECTVQFCYKGAFAWERVCLKAVRDEQGRLTKAQGYSINVTSRRSAEENLERERLRLKAMSDGVFETFTFNITQDSAPDIQTSDRELMTQSVSEAVVQQALRVAPPIGHTNDETRDVLLRAAARIPDDAQREEFLRTCSGDGMRRAVRQGRYSALLRYRRFVGSAVRWVSTQVEILPDPATGDMIAFCYTRDINEQVIQEKMAGRVMGMNYETVSYCDLQLGRLYVNLTNSPLDAAIAGTPYAEAAEAAVRETVPPEAAESLLQRMQLPTILAHLEKAPVYTVYYERIERRTDLPGTPRRQMKNDVFYLDEHKDVLVFLLSDVTEIFEHNRENKDRMAAALAAARQASMAKSNFLSRMSHEIRTPLNAIIGMDTLAAQAIGNDERVSDCISKIGISARYLLSLINDILDMSRIESGKMLLKNEKFLFRDFVSGINAMIYNQCSAKGLDYECTVSSEVAEAYIGDAMKLQQVLVNILGNAVKFTTKGRVTFDVHPIAHREGLSTLRFAVNDTGAGIPEDFQERIFEPFEQADTTTTTIFGGTGLGLAITKNLVDLMGGSIRVRSIVGVGSEFTVEIPLTVDESVLVQPRLDLHFEKMHTLIVDDDLVVCEQTCDILRGIGMEGEWVTAGSEAVQRVERNSRQAKFYDFILVDWKMPDMNGLETTRQIRRIVGPDVTIIIITAYDWESIEAEAKAAGANLLISKPLLKSTLVSAFQKAKGQAEAEPAPLPDFDFAGLRVLVAEDNQLNAEIARSLLESKHFEVEVAANGQKALERYAQNPPGYYDAVLMDIRMPLMDGLQTATNIRHWDKADAKTIPIIAMTANAFDEDVDKSKAVGMNAHLSKPIDPNLMFSTLYRILNEKE